MYVGMKKFLKGGRGACTAARQAGEGTCGGQHNAGQHERNVVDAHVPLRGRRERHAVA
jgi:hypothetical protein